MKSAAFIGLGSGMAIKLNASIFSSTIDYELYALIIVIGLQVGRDLRADVIKRVSWLAIISIIIDIIGATIAALILTPIYPFKEILLVMLGLRMVYIHRPIYSEVLWSSCRGIGLSCELPEGAAHLSFNAHFLQAQGFSSGRNSCWWSYQHGCNVALGDDYIMGAVINGLILTLLVPIMLPVITIIMSMLVIFLALIFLAPGIYFSFLHAQKIICLCQYGLVCL